MQHLGPGCAGYGYQSEVFGTATVAVRASSTGVPHDFGFEMLGNWFFHGALFLLFQKSSAGQ